LSAINGAPRRLGRSALLGLGLGWLAGMLWWCGLVSAFGPSVIVTHDEHGWQEREIPVLHRLSYVPLVAIPWAVIGGVIGLVAGWLRSYLVPTAAIIGMLLGGAWALANHPFDGWLALEMPLYCFIGSFWGLAVGAAAALGWRKS
jgi:hypothetical protein